MQRFYEEAIGLELIKRFENAAFLKLADGYEGHTQVIALFDRKSQAGYAGLDPLKTTVDHIAFEISLADFLTEKDRLERLGLAVTMAGRASLDPLALSLCLRPRGTHGRVGLF
jgi:hypothetical protein